MQVIFYLGYLGSSLLSVHVILIFMLKLVTHYGIMSSKFLMIFDVTFILAVGDFLLFFPFLKSLDI